MNRALAAVPLIALAGCGGSSGSGGSSGGQWRDLRSVTVTVNQALAPPLGHQQRTFAGAALVRVTSELNANHIAAAPADASSGCSGGFAIELRIVRTSGAVTTLDTYRCANHTYGGISGDLVRFLGALGFSV